MWIRPSSHGWDNPATAMIAIFAAPPLKLDIRQIHTPGTRFGHGSTRSVASGSQHADIHGWNVGGWGGGK
jgi:hypothetical protein